MKKIFFLAFFASLFAATAFASQITFAWDPNNVAQEVDEYRLYEDGVLKTTTTETTATIETSPGRHTYYVTAANVWSESGPSNLITTPELVTPPERVVITITVDIK